MYSVTSTGSKAIISKRYSKKMAALAGTITPSRHRCTMTCKFLIELSIWFMLALMIILRTMLRVTDAPTAPEAAVPAEAMMAPAAGSI